MTPKVSHYIICYNQAEFIARSMTSAVEQDYDNLQVVVADDGSTDGTAELVREVSAKYPGRVVPVLSEKNGGITANSNRALARCDGRYVSSQGGDDILLPGKIRSQVRWLEEDARRVLCGHDVRVFYSGIAGREHVLGPGRAGRGGVGAGPLIREGVGSFFMGTSLMWRASAAPPSGYDVRLPIVSDWKFIIDVAGTDGVWGAVDGVYALYRRHPRNISAVARDAILRDCLESLRLTRAEFPGFREEVNYARQAILYGFAKMYYRKGMRRQAERLLRGLLFRKGERHRDVSVWKLLRYLAKCKAGL